MLQFISHYTDKYSYLDSIRLALQGGCRWIQLRMKDATDDEVRPIAIEAQQLCQKFGATFVIDDRVALVKELQADGVHLGKNDMPIAEARRLLGPDYIIGGTANTIWDVKAHYAAGADYIGCGPFRFTTTKQKLSPVLGLDGYRRIIIEMRAAHIDIPIVAIGSISKDDIPAILATGITGIALSGTVLRAANPIDEMKHLTNIVNHE